MGTQKRYGRQQKLDLLSAYQDALTHSPDHVMLWLDAVGTDADRMGTWRAQLAAGELAGDEVSVPAGAHPDGSIAKLANLYRARITQVKPAVHSVAPGSAAGLVVFDTDGFWHLDYLARARSALRHVITVAQETPEVYLRPTGVDPETAVAAVRAACGVDRFPHVDRPSGDAAAREAADKRINRWSEQLFSKPEAFASLLEWYRMQEAPLRPLPTVPGDTPPSWQRADPANWPSGSEREWLDDVAWRHLGELPQLARLGEDRQRIIVMRRTAQLVSEYIRDNRQLNGAKIYYQHHVVRLWQAYSMEDLRTPEERSSGATSGATDKAVIAAVAAMCLHTVIREWDPAAAARTVDRAVDIFVPFSTRSPESNHRARAVAHRKQRAELPKIQPVVTPQHPPFIKDVSERVAALFFASDLLRLAPGPVHVDEYLAKRRLIDVVDRRKGNGEKVIQLADYAANLAVASAAVRKRLQPWQLLALKQALLRSTAATPLSAAIHRNDALSLQRRRYDGAITEGLRGRETLERLGSEPGVARRDRLIVEEQLCLNLAGSAVQWLEHLLAGDSRWQRGIEREQWQGLSNFALQQANRAVEIIEGLHEEGELATQRYADGFLADESFLFRAWDILYRCTCVAATAAAAFGFDDPVRDYDFARDLRSIHLSITTIDKPIAVGELPRLLHSMLWHTFLDGGVLPALKYDTLNTSLVDKDALTRVLTPDELADPTCSTVMTYTRIALLTDWLIERGWTAGAIGELQPGSRPWQELDERSGGLYSVWREDFGTLLTSAFAEPPAIPPRDPYSFHTNVGYPGTSGR